MTTSDEAFADFKELFTPDRGIIGRTAALKAGVELVHTIATEESEGRDPQVVAAEITAIGTMVGQYVNALASVKVEFGYNTQLRLDGIHGSSFPRKLEVDVRMRPPEEPTAPVSDSPQ